MTQIVRRKCSNRVSIITFKTPQQHRLASILCLEHKAGRKGTVALRSLVKTSGKYAITSHLAACSSAAISPAWCAMVQHRIL
jgi:hypothetical protein